MSDPEHYDSASGFHVIRVHYSSDPEKDPSTQKGAVWFENEPKGYLGGITSAQWRQEMEIDWDAAGGELVFPQMEIFKNKIVAIPYEIPEDWPKYGSFDYGHRNPSSFHVYTIDYDGNILSIWEYYQRGQGYRQIARAIRACPYFDKLAYPPMADPSIWAKNQQQGSTDENEVKSIAQLFYELPEDERIMFAPGRAGGDITVAEKVNGELWNNERLKKGEEPRFKIFSTCPMQIWEFLKLRYADWSGTMAEQRNMREQLVDKDNHSFDDFKYFMMQFFISPTKPEEEKMAKLKREDPTSYNEWKSVERMHEEEEKVSSTMGGFENEEDDYE